MWINGPLLYAIGPSFYLHVKEQRSWKDLLHFLPLLIMIVWITPFYVKSAEEKLSIIQSFYAPDFKPELELMQYLYVLHIGLYCLLGYRSLTQVNRLSLKFNTDARQIIHKQRSQALYLLVAVLSILSFTVCLLADQFGIYYGRVDKFTISMLVFLIISLQVYFSFYGYECIPPVNAIENEAGSPIPSRTNSKDHTELIQRLDLLMQVEKPYRRPDLKIGWVADQLRVSLHELSAAINQEKKQHFYDYINGYRVEELKQTLLDPKNTDYTLAAIAEAAGINSRTSFYRIFKKQVGCTPKQYIDRHKSLQ